MSEPVFRSSSSFEETLKKDGRLIYTNVGTSMSPLIRPGRDLLVIESSKGRIKKYDIVLYRRDSGQYVLHRVLYVRENDYVMCGDHQYHREYGITDSHILGVMKARIRGGKVLHMNNWKCRIYAHFWCDLFPLRAVVLNMKKVVDRIF